MADFYFKENRRSGRIEMCLPIRVRGADATGDQFEELTRTLEVSRNGVKFESKISLRPNQEIYIVNARHGREASFRVVGQVPGPVPSVAWWGAECLDGSPDLWGINFPHIEEAQEATARVFLQCAQCETQEPSYLSELETEVFNLSQRVHRHCSACGGWTEWLKPEAGTEVKAPVAVPPPRSREAREHRRLGTQMQAYIRTRIGDEEVVKAENISTGGLAVVSKKTYSIDSLVKVSFPYYPDGANIIVLGRIARVSGTEEPGTFLYGIQYLPIEKSTNRRLIIRYITPDSPRADFIAGGLQIAGQVRDISHAGMFISTKEPVAVGKVGKVGVEFPKGLFRASAIVGNVKTDQGFALKFLNMSSADREALRSFCDALRSAEAESKNRL